MHMKYIAEPYYFIQVSLSFKPNPKHCLDIPYSTSRGSQLLQFCACGDKI